MSKQATTTKQQRGRLAELAEDRAAARDEEAREARFAGVSAATRRAILADELAERRSRLAHPSARS